MVARKWVFVVATYNENSKRASIYVDGVKTSGKTKMDMSADFTMIGANTKNNNDFEALIDEVRIYDRILSKSEIKALRKLQTKIDDFKKKEKTKYYLPKQNNLIVRSQPSKNAKVLGKLATTDTLRSKIQVPSKGGRRNEWLKIDYKGKKGYVQLSYVKVHYVEDENLSDFEKMTKGYMNWGNWVFWVIMILFLGLGIGGSAGFGGIDGMLNAITGNDFDGNVAFFPIITGFSGFILAILMVIWQDGIEYYLIDNFSYWPAGYGFAAWVVWIVLVINLLVLLFMIFESLACGNIIHGILRIAIQLVLAFFTLYSVFAITIALIIIVVIFILAKAIKSIVIYKITTRNPDIHKEILLLYDRLIYWSIIALGFIFSFNILGVNLELILARVSLGIGFAFKDIISNFISGVMILSQKKFKIGDFVAIGDKIGVIEEMEVRTASDQRICSTGFFLPLNFDGFALITR